MTTKREERKQRAELEKQQKERQRRQRAMRSRLLVAAGALAVITIGVMLVRRERPSGRVWSAEHGHWHDK
jgi:hypothetical protein